MLVFRYMYGVLLCLVLTGCESTGYYWQAAKGQWSVVSKREPITEVIASDKTPEKLKQKLRQVEASLLFAEQKMSLPSHGSYRDYVALDHDYVVWNVYAAEPFSVDSYRWCYPLLGCVGYRGYFDRDQAQRYSEQLSLQGLDTFVGGVAAYSTLGWFDDPVLSSFLRRDDLALTALLFHELAHQKIYLNGDTAFNESFATAVAVIGIRQWIAQNKRASEADYQRWRYNDRRTTAFHHFLLASRDSLQNIYSDKDLSMEQKHSLKNQQYEKIHYNYQEFVARWQGYRGYDNWMKMLNNAKLATVADYNIWLPSMLNLYAQTNNWPAFYAAVEQISVLAADERKARLEQLAKAKKH